MKTHFTIAATCVLAFQPCVGMSAEKPAARDVRLSVSLQVDLRPDIGQNFGTLFEAVDNAGDVLAGAGFLGNYNTETRSDRRNLQFFVKPGERSNNFMLGPLPRPTGDAGVYLYEFDDHIFAHGRGGKDPNVYAWDDLHGQWRVGSATPAFNVHVGSGKLVAAADQISYNDHPVVSFGSDNGRVAEWYYANGCLIFRRMNADKSPPLNELIALRWSPGVSTPLELSRGTVFSLRTPGEFVYAYGQLKNHVVAATNTGGVYSFDGDAWKVWREPNGVSFQIYSMINFEDRLLMGQYPTGHLFQFDGSRFELLVNHPPVMRGVSPNAREAQTLTIYGGELYVGVWPWGEVWRFNRNRRDWRLAGRVFTHPEPTAATTHPYEKETTALDPVLNRWGQRVTSLIPHGDALWISTSAKSSDPYEPKFAFLDGEKHKEYGAVYRYRQPGNLTMQTAWKDGPTRFEFAFANSRVTISQDGKQLGSTALEPGTAAKIAQSKIATGKGIYGDFRGILIEPSASEKSR